MKKQDVIISLQTVQNAGGADGPDTLSFMTDGSYTFDGTEGCLSYDESEITGLPGTRTTVRILPDEIVVDRSGYLTSRMTFKEGEKTSFLYQRPFGDTTLRLNTRKVRHNFNDRGGTAEVDYVIDFAHEHVSENRLIIHVQQTGGLNQCQI